MGALRKLPPDVARELLRHVSPRPLKKMAQQPHHAAEALKRQQSQKSSSSSGSGMVLAGCVIFTAGAFSVPFVLHRWIGNLNARDEPLTHAQIRRGAFLNSGSTDAGRDPQWDFRKGEYRKDENYWALFDNKDNVAEQAFGGAAIVKKEADRGGAESVGNLCHLRGPHQRCRGLPVGP